MNLKDFVAVNGLPGLYRLVATRSNGILVQEFDSDKTRFAATRKHPFTPLESVAIYTDSDSTDLSEIFKRIEGNLEDHPLPESEASKKQCFDYFSEILPDYDQERVLISDVKKIIKWFKFLKDRDLLQETEEEKEEKEKQEENISTVQKKESTGADKPKTDTAKRKKKIK